MICSVKDCKAQPVVEIHDVKGKHLLCEDDYRAYCENAEAMKIQYKAFVIRSHEIR